MNARELRELTKEELQAKLKDLKEELFNIKFKHSTNPESNPMIIRATRKDIARIETIMRQK